MPMFNFRKLYSDKCWICNFTLCKLTGDCNFKLKGAKNTLNQKNIYLNERLPSTELELTKAIDKLCYVTITINSAVCVVCSKFDSSEASTPIQKLDDLK